jgi:hypothetical protein
MVVPRLVTGLGVVNLSCPQEAAYPAASSATTLLALSLTLATHDFPQRTKKSERLVDSAH